MTSSSGTPGTGPGECAALDGPTDPENPAATYVLEPEVDAPLAQRVVTGNEAGMHRSVLPFTGAPLAAFPVSSVEDVARAVDRARAAQPAWAARSVRERAAVLRRFGE